MLVGICEIFIYLPNSHSLKHKRSILSGYIKPLKRMFNISIVEIGQKNLWKNGIIGIACIGENRKTIDGIIEKIINFTDSHPEIQLINYTVTVN